MKSDNSWSRSPLLALCVIGAAPFVSVALTGCEDELEPRAYLGPAEAPAYTAPPVYTPGVPTSRPAPTEGLIELPPATVATCQSTGGLSLSATEVASLGLADRVVIVSSGIARAATLGASSNTCPSDDAAGPLTFDGVGALRAVDGRGPALVAGATGIAAVAISGATVLCDLPGAKALARTPDTDTGFAITGSRDLFALDWSSETCVITPIALPEGFLGTLALGTSATSGPWIATAERNTTLGSESTVIARARRFDVNVGAFDELSPALGGQAGTLCGIDAIAVTDDGERVAIIDGACGRIVVFRASDGEIVGGASTRAKSLAPVPGERAFLTVASVADQASFARIDAPLAFGRHPMLRPGRV